MVPPSYIEGLMEGFAVMDDDGRTFDLLVAWAFFVGRWRGYGGLDTLVRVMVIVIGAGKEG